MIFNTNKKTTTNKETPQTTIKIISILTEDSGVIPPIHLPIILKGTPVIHKGIQVINKDKMVTTKGIPHKDILVIHKDIVVIHKGLVAAILITHKEDIRITLVVIRVLLI